MVVHAKPPRQGVTDQREWQRVRVDVCGSLLTEEAIECAAGVSSAQAVFDSHAYERALDIDLWTIDRRRTPIGIEDDDAASRSVV